MNFSADTKLKLYRVLRSLFRYVEFNNNKSALPSILIELEKGILRDYLLKLNVEEIRFISLEWPKFKNEQRINDEIDNTMLDLDISRLFKSLN